MIATGSDVHLLRQITSVLSLRRRLVFTTAFIAIAVVGCVALLLPPRYTAKAQILVDPQHPNSSALDDGAIETRVEMLMSPSHLQAILNSFETDPERRTEPRPRLPITNFLVWAGVWPSSPAPAREANAPDGFLSAPDPITLSRKLSAFKERHSRLIAVTYTSGDPELAAFIANRATQLYVDGEAARNRNDRLTAKAEIDRRIPGVRDDLERAETALHSYRIAQGLGDASRSDEVEQQLASLSRDLALANAELTARKDQVRRLKEIRAHADADPADVGAILDPNLAPLMRQRTAVAEAANSAATDATRETVPSQGRGAVPKDLDNSAAQAALKLQHEVDAGAARVAFYQQRLAALQDVSASSRHAQIKVRELEREVAAGAKLYENLLQQQNDLVTKDDLLPDVRLVSPAGIPDESSSPNPLLFLLPTILFACILGAVLAIIAERMNRKLRTGREATRVLGIPCIGNIPEIGIPHQSRLHDALLSDPFSDFTEAVRSVAVTCMGLSATDGRGKTILVTSSRQEEGKTSVAVSLAFYSALMMKKVLLVDLDFRNPGIVKELDEDPNGGVLNVLAGLPVGEAISHSKQKGLDYLPLPPTRVDPATVLGSNELQNILEGLKSRYDLIVIDSAAVLGSAETRLFASLVDWVIFAVRWNRSGDEAQQALAQLTASGPGGHWKGRIFAVLTRVSLPALRRYEKADLAQGHSGPYLATDLVTDLSLAQIRRAG